MLRAALMVALLLCALQGSASAGVVHLSDDIWTAELSDLAAAQARPWMARHFHDDTPIKLLDETYRLADQLQRKEIDTILAKRAMTYGELFAFASAVGQATYKRDRAAADTEYARLLAKADAYYKDQSGIIRNKQWRSIHVQGVLTVVDVPDLNPTIFQKDSGEALRTLFKQVLTYTRDNGRCMVLGHSALDTVR